MVSHFFRVFFRHDLHAQRPFREIAALDGIVQIALVAFTVFADDGFCFGIGKVFNALLGAEVEFDPIALLVGRDKAVSVRTKAVHVAI